ncbi:MAG TPA: sigma-70 family RNA polymerase sigma factor [Anaerolineae bacterium]|nr:sigma-70 family RNA polymerase sigma factor [Anaerolineae bacterium]
MTDRLSVQQEQRLLAQALHNPAAFQTLYRHYFPKVYAYVSYRVGRVAETEDIVSDVFLRVVEQLAKFEWRGEGSFAAWLFRLAHNRVADFFRRSRAQTRPIPLEELPDIAAHEALPGEALLRKELFEQLRSLLETLSPRRQEIISLKFFGGLRNRDIAELLGLDERTVASHLSRGLAELQQKVEQTTAPMQKGAS